MKKSVFVKRTAKLIHVTNQRFLQMGYFSRAAALAFTTLLAIVPLLTVILFVFTFFPGFADFMQLAENYFFDNFIPASTIDIKNYFHTFTYQASQLPLMSILFLFFVTLSLVNTVEETFNEIWQSKKRRGRISALVFYCLFILLTPLLLGGSLFISGYILSLSLFEISIKHFELTALIAFLLPIGINTLLFSWLYILVPSVIVDWRKGLMGGFIAALLFEISRIGFSFYIARYSTYGLIYDSFSIIPIFLLWLNIFWVIILWCGLAICVDIDLLHKKTAEK